MPDTPDVSLLDRPTGRYGEDVPTPTETALDAITRVEQARRAIDKAMDERDGAIIEMSRAGMTPPAIGRALGMSTANVRHILGPPRRRA